MAAKAASQNPYKRHPVKGHKGVTYRVLANGERAYAFYNGKSYVNVEGGLDEAIERLAEARKAARRGERVVTNDRTKYADYFSEWIELRETSGKRPLRARTAKEYRAAHDLVLSPRFGSWRLTAIDAEAISHLIRDLEREGLHAIDRQRPARPLGAAAISNYLKPLQGTLSLAVRRRIIRENPFTHLTADDRPASAPKKKLFDWSVEATQSLLAASAKRAKAQNAQYDYTPLLRLAATLGPRLGEVLGLQWQDFDKDEGVLHIRRQWLVSGEYGPTKTPAGVRTIALPSALRDELIALRLASRFSQDTDPIFASREGTPLNHRNVAHRGFEPARDDAGLPAHLTFHDLRHAAASRVIAAGLDPVTVASVLGHENANITLAIYAHLYDRKQSDEAVRAALAMGGASART
jgi:integrase